MLGCDRILKYCAYVYNVSNTVVKEIDISATKIIAYTLEYSQHQIEIIWKKGLACPQLLCLTSAKIFDTYRNVFFNGNI